MNTWWVIRCRVLALSFKLNQRVITALVVMLGITGVTLVGSVGQGEYFIAPLDVLKTLLGISTGDPNHRFVILTLRLPRALVAFAVGMGLAVSGSILQGLTRNPLADPGILGINAGASLAAVFTLVVFPTVSTYILPLVAFLGGMTVAVGIYALSWHQGHMPLRLILTGIGLSAMIGALTTLLVTFGEINSVSQALVWLTGSVYGRSWEHLWPLLPWLLVFIPLSWGLARDLNSFHLGETVAQGLGVPISWSRGWLLLASASLAGAAVATAGTLSFVGLITPHLARRWVGASHEGLILVAGLMGGILVLLSDWIGRALFAPLELPCGLITALLGAPYLMYLLYRSQKQ